LLRLCELLRLLLEGGLGLLELLLLREVLLAQVQELALAPTLGRAIGRGTRTLELGLELRDLTLELVDRADGLAVVYARLLAFGVRRHVSEPEIDDGLVP